jgi:hypothetical protein
MIALVLAMLVLAGAAHAQTFNLTGTTSVQVTIAPEAALSVTTATSALTATAGTFANDFVGTTSLQYKIRTAKSGGVAHITAQVTTDFVCLQGGPCVANAPSSGDALSYTCTVSAPGTACTGSQISSTTTPTPVASFGADAKSAKDGNSAFGSLEPHQRSEILDR